MLQLIVLPAAQDPMPLSRYLWQQGISHRVLPDEAGQKVFWLLEPQQQAQAIAALDAWYQGQVDQPVASTPSLLALTWRSVPVCLALIACSLLITLGFFWYPGQQVFLWTSFTPLLPQMTHILSAPISETLISGQWWRLITPIFLHFGWMHLVFNLMWLWVLGGAIERQQGSVRLLLLVVCAALISNTAQFVFNDSSLFGGMSGVVYACLGYTWLWDRRHPGSRLGLTNGLMLFMLLWLVFGMLPVSQAMGLYMANEAHLGGLLAGFAFALLPWSNRR